MQKGNAMEGPVGVRGAALNRPLPPPGLLVRSWPSGFLAASAVQSALPVTHRVLLGLDGCRWLERGSAERGQPLRWEVPWCSSHSSHLAGNLPQGGSSGPVGSPARGQDCGNSASSPAFGQCECRQAPVWEDVMDAYIQTNVEISEDGRLIYTGNLA